MARSWYETALLCAKEAAAVVSRLELGGITDFDKPWGNTVRYPFGELIAQPKNPKATWLFAPGFYSPENFYYPKANYWRKQGHETFFLKSLYKRSKLVGRDVVMPKFPHDAYRCMFEILARKRKGCPLYIECHSIGGIVLAGIYYPRLVDVIDRLIILGTPFSSEFVPHFLLNLVERKCKLRYREPCEIIENILNFVLNAPPESFKKILYITVDGDPIAPPESGGFPRTLAAYFTSEKDLRHPSTWFSNSHCGLVTDPTTIQLEQCFVNSDLEREPDIHSVMEQQFPSVHFSRSDVIPTPSEIVERVFPEKIVYNKRVKQHTYAA